MPEAASDQSLLEELDARQDDILVALDELNSRIERLLHEYLAVRSEPAALGTVGQV